MTELYEKVNSNFSHWKGETEKMQVMTSEVSDECLHDLIMYILILSGHKE